MGWRVLRLAAFVLFLILPGVARAGDAPVGPADSAAIRAVIADQLSAFLHDDGPGAFSYASPTIQQLFHDPGTFMDMVRTGYRSVYRARGVEFRELGMMEKRLIQQVYMTGPDGIPVLALYEMQRQADGSWRINGVSIARAPDQGV
jgi:hypothetical protein